MVPRVFVEGVVGAPSWHSAHTYWPKEEISGQQAAHALGQLQYISQICKQISESPQSFKHVVQVNPQYRKEAEGCLVYFVVRLPYVTLIATLNTRYGCVKEELLIEQIND